MQPAGGTYHQRTTMTMPVHQPGQTMMNFVGQQYPPNAMTAPMMQQPAQQAMPMMAPYYAPNQQPYTATNQQQPGYFRQAGVGNDKLVNSGNLTHCLTHSHNYAHAASVLLRTITTYAATIKQWAILNSGATSHFLTTDAPASNIIPASVPLIARLPNGGRVQSMHTCTLNLPNLPAGTRAAHIIPSLASHSLLSFITMCNPECTVTFTKINCTITYQGCTIICGHKCNHTGLWMIPLRAHDSQAANPPGSIDHTPPTAVPTFAIATNVDATSSAAEYACYIHQFMCSPPSVTLLRALDRSEELTTIPGLTLALIKNHLPCSTATDKGHMRQHRSNTASTRNLQNDIVAAHAKVERMFPRQELCSMQDVFCFAALANAITGTMYTNITSAFPVRLLKSMQYIFVAYIYDLNAIIIRAMPSHTDASMVSVFTEVITILKAGGYQPALNVMDNNCSAAVKNYIRSKKINIQLTPPHNHRVNATERAIATFKEHFIAALATMDMHYPLELWDEFLPQVELTLNMLCASQWNPNKSANQEVYSSFDFNKTPLAPLGTKALIYDDPASHASWAPHATNGFYIGPASNHYRCLRFYIPSTRRLRFSDTWCPYPTHCQIPVTLQHDLSIAAAADILQSLGGTVPTTTTAKIKHIRAIQKMTAIMAGH
jgi:hypothetical protein